MKVKQVAQAFAAGKKLSVGNASTDGETYQLFGNTIARRVNGSVIIDWCGWYSVSTARHINNIANAIGSPKRVSYAQAREGGHTCVLL
jgi:hypothetical protein